MNEQHFGVLYQKFFSPIYRYIARRVSDRQDAEDIAQHVFLKLFNSSLDFNQPNDKPLAYLYTIARHLVADYWSTNRQSSVPIDNLPELQNEKDCEQTWQKTIDLTQALNSLTLEHRKIIELKFRDGLTTQETARRLAKTEAAIRQAQCRALKQIRTAFSTTL